LYVDARAKAGAAALDAASKGGSAAKAGAGALPRFDTTVRAEWVDYNGHMSDFLYGYVFGDAMDALYRSVGIDEAARRNGRMFYTAESHVRHLGEAKVGEDLYATTQILGVDDKRLHVFHRLYRRRDDALIASGEQMHLHVDTTQPKAVPMDAGLRAKLETLRQAHAKLGAPAEAGKPVGSRVKG
jgi:carnitine 3-dehydrogenase